MMSTMYNVRDKKGRFAKVTQMVTNQPKVKKLVNHIALVLDRSGSMAGCMQQAKEALKEQLRNIKELSNKNNQETFVSVVEFDNMITTLCAGQNINSLNINSQIDGIYARNDTALNDAIVRAIDNLGNRQYPDEDESFAMIIITDGHENRSSTPSNSVRTRIAGLIKTGLWTFAFNGPYGSKNQINALYGIPIGNINEWENTVQGTQTMSHSNSVGTQSFYRGRVMGQTATANFYEVDMSQVNTNKISKLSWISPKHNKVEKEIGIEEFFLNKGQSYPLGQAFYELTKKEEVQDYKRLIILDLDTGYYYADSPNFTVRQFIGMPESGTTKLDPKNVGKYRIYVQSTSTNRKLVRGTTLLVY